MAWLRLSGLVLLLLSATTAPAFAADGARRHLAKADAWFAGPEARQIAAHLLSWQADSGGWPKNVDTAAKPYAGPRQDLRPTFDNGATTDELRFLARYHNAAADPAARAAFLKGLDYILTAQYPTGGFPQFHPPPSRSYHRHITFNDGAMVRLLEFLREVAAQPPYRFLDAPRRQAAQGAFDRGIACILKCQVRVDGKLTAWCAQHDEKDYRPRPGRAYELASLSGSESVGITRLLMSLEKPTPEVIQAVDAAAAWFATVRITGLAVVDRDDPDAPNGKTRVAVPDPAARPLWARFYELGTNRPLFSDRDGAPKYDFNQLGHERRTGYAWLGPWPAPLLEKDYPAWRKKNGLR